MADPYSSLNRDELARVARAALALLEQTDDIKEKRDTSQAASALAQPDIQFHHSELCRSSGELKQQGAADSNTAAVLAQIQAEYPNLLAFFKDYTIGPQGVQASAAANADWRSGTEDHVLFTTDDGTAYAMRLAHQRPLIVLPPCCRGGPPCNRQEGAVRGLKPAGYRSWRIAKAPGGTKDIVGWLTGPGRNPDSARQQHAEASSI
ncbi:NADH:ubiquinone oxidoreductase [Hypoxylon texense]